jgi:biotin synthase
MTAIRNNWSLSEAEAIYNSPFLDLLYRAATVHRQNHDPQEVQVCTLLSVKTGGCPEDCAYCPQAARYHTDVKVHKLMEVEEVLEAASQAKAKGSTRFSAWVRVLTNQNYF